MTSSISKLHAAPGFPRYFKVCGSWVNAFQVFLCLGIYTGILVSAALAARSGISPLRMGLGCLACVIVGLAGARVYHLLVFAPHYMRQRSLSALWDSRKRGISVFLWPLSPGPLSGA